MQVNFPAILAGNTVPSRCKSRTRARGRETGTSMCQPDEFTFNKNSIFIPCPRQIRKLPTCMVCELEQTRKVARVVRCHGFALHAISMSGVFAVGCGVSPLLLRCDFPGPGIVILLVAAISLSSGDSVFFCFRILIGHIAVGRIPYR